MAGQKNNLETKQICMSCKSIEFAKRVIRSIEPMILINDGQKFSYDKETNILTIADNFGETKYKPLILFDGTIFPFNKRVKNCKY